MGDEDEAGKRAVKSHHAKNIWQQQKETHAHKTLLYGFE